MWILFTCVFSFSRRMLCFYITISFQTLYKARVHQKPRNHIIHILHAYIWCTVMPIGINFLSKCLELRVHQINLWSSLPNFYYYYVHITYTKLVHKYNSITQLAFFKLERHNAMPVTFQVAHNSKKNTMWHFWKIHWKKIQDECYLFDQVVSPCQTYLKTDMNYYFVQDIENVYFKHRIL